jgi:hypothetical protein
MATQTIFETETCTRCGGCGRYSYCQMYGDTCFKCNGKGKTYTARGQAAKAYYTSLCSAPLSELTVGMEIWCENFFGKSGWSAITSIHPDELNEGMVTVETARLSQGVWAKEVNTFRVRQTAEQVQAKQAQAIAFERSLNKNGKTSLPLAKLMTRIAWG